MKLSVGNFLGGHATNADLSSDYGAAKAEQVPTNKKVVRERP